MKATDKGNGSGRSRRRSSGKIARRGLLAGRSQRALARRLKMDHTHLSRIVRGQRAPSLEMAGRIASALGLTIDQLQRELAKVQKLNAA